MDHLDRGDTIAVLEAAADLMSIASDADFMTSVLVVVESLIPCEMITYNEIDIATGKTYVAVYPLHWIERAEEIAVVFDRTVHDHPLVVNVPRCTNAIRFEDVVDDEALFATTFYREFFDGLLGFRYSLAIRLPAPSWQIFALGLCRRPGNPFTDREVALLDALGPHIIHNCRRAEVERSQASLTTTSAEGGWAAVSVNAKGTVLRIDGSPGPEFVVGQQVPAEVRDVFLEPRHEGLLHSGGRTVTTETLGASVRVHSTPGADYLLLVQRGGTDLRTSLGGQGFTRRQVDVAEQLLVGGTNDHIARRLEISSGTVRKHLEALYRGLGVQDRSSAIAKIAGHASRIGAV